LKSSCNETEKRSWSIGQVFSVFSFVTGSFGPGTGLENQSVTWRILAVEVQDPSGGSTDAIVVGGKGCAWEESSERTSPWPCFNNGF